MILKDKFDAYKSDLDPTSWEHFKSLRRKKKKKRFFFWSWIIGLFAITFGTMITWMNYETSNSDKILSEVSHEDVFDANDINGFIQDDTLNLLSKKYNVSETKYMQKITNGELKKGTLVKDPLENTKLLHIEEKERVASIIRISSKKSFSQDDAGSSFDEENLDSYRMKLDNQSGDIRKSVLELPQVKKDDKRESILSQNKNTKKEVFLVSENVPFVDLIDIQPFLIQSVEGLRLVSEIIPPKVHQIKRNYIFLSFGHADGFINGFSVDNPVNKQGIALHLTYLHDWSKIIGTGVSIGYINAFDQANDQYVIKDKETIKYIHAKLYLNLIHEDRHQLRMNVGAGPTITDRVLGTFFFIPSQGILERRFQINTLSSIGVSAGARYNYNLSEKIGVGAYGSIISHNDGGWDVGISVSHIF